MKALLVEDDAITRRMLEKVLEAESFETSSFEDAEASWYAIRTEFYPLIILDWMLPGISGLELCQRIRRLPQGSASLVLMITSRNDPGDLEKVLEAGVDDYIPKPLDFKLLKVRFRIARQQAENLLRRKHAENELEKAFQQMERSHADLLSILNELRIGTALIEESGEVTFLSKTASELLGVSEASALGQSWRKIFPFSEKQKQMIGKTASKPQKTRQKLLLVSNNTDKKSFRIEIEVGDDPRNPDRKIFFLYDVAEVHELRRQLGEKASFHDIVGKSEKMRSIYQLIQDLSPLDTTVLIDGDTGTGKELVARAVHFSSSRQKQPFIALNCAGLTESLVASQLFGHKKGAFTGAINDHKGVFESGNGGTVFLDEVGEIPLNIQSSLLRVLENREISRVGEATTRKVNVRIISATNRDLGKMVEDGQFRRDLLYRLRVARIALPGLKERREDIPALVDVFLRQLRSTIGKSVTAVSDAAYGALMAYAWPGNVRELRNAIEFSVIRCRGNEIEIRDLPPEITQEVTMEESLRQDRLGVPRDEKAELVHALKQSNGNRTRAAKILGLSRATLYRRLADYGSEFE